MCLCAAVVPAWTSGGLILTSAITLASRAPAILAEAPTPRGLGVGPCIILCPAPFRGRLNLEVPFGSSHQDIVGICRRALLRQGQRPRTHCIRPKAPPLVDMRASLARVQCWRFAAGVAAAPSTLFRTYLRSMSTAPRRCVPPLWAKIALSPSVRSGRLTRDCPFCPVMRTNRPPGFNG